MRRPRRTGCARDGAVTLGIPFFADQRYKAGHIDRRRAGALARCAYETGAGARFAVLIEDVRLVLVAEMADSGEHRVRRGLAEAAE